MKIKQLFLLLFFALLSVTQVWAEFSPGTYYLQTESNTFIDALAVNSSNPGAKFQTSSATAFTFTAVNDGYTIQNASNGNYLLYSTANNWDTKMSELASETNYAGTWTVTEDASGKISISRQHSSTTYYLGNSNTNVGTGVYSGQTSAVWYTLVPKVDIDTNKTYLFKHKNTGKYMSFTTANTTATSLVAEGNATSYVLQPNVAGFSIKQADTENYLALVSNGWDAAVKNTATVWYIVPASEPGDYIIKKSTAESGAIFFGTDRTDANIGTGLYTNVGSPCVWTLQEVTTPAPTTDTPAAIAAMLERIGGTGASDLITAELNESIAEGGKDVYVITSANGKPHVKGSSINAIAAGIGYYLNHYAKVNLTWNNLTTNLSAVSLPVPASEDKHVCTADYRYYLNYCTYSYSMSVWDEDRWMKEIDWMALHGINMPLAIVGMEAVWQKLLTDADANKRITASADANALNSFVPGPSYQAWWLMGNLQGMGGPNPDWWYTHQAELGKKIVDRMRELGMEPVLPGFAGQVPTAASGLDAVSNGAWCSFTSPALVKPGTDNFNTIASKYYDALTEVFGTTKYYSMDLFHETGGAPSGIDAQQMYESVAAAMPTDSKWLIQQWQWSGTQGNSCSWVGEDKLVVLDLWSEVKQGWKNTYGGAKNFNGREMIYCMLHNFGGRTGIYGRLNQTINGYYEALNTSGLKTKGVGATPEGIETNPILYDALYEMPWTTISNVNDWVANWVEARYGADNDEAKAAWALLTSDGGILNCTTQQQGVSEPIICARPGLEIPSASAWSTSKIYYDMQKVIKAAETLMNQKSTLSGKNYSYDLTDVVRQIMTDQAQPLLAEIKKAYEARNWTKYDALVARFTTLITDVDRLLATNEDFMLGRWTSLARRNAGSGAAPSWSNPNYADAGYNAGFTCGADWTEWNARKLITTWGYTKQCNNGRLRDYSQREWSGLLKDFYLPRWQKYFTQLKAGTNIGREDVSWYAEEDAWCRNYSKQYTTTITEQTGDVAAELFPKYFGKFAAASGDYYINLGFPSTEANVMDNAFRGETYTPVITSTPNISSVAIDLNGDGTISSSETVVASSIEIPAEAKSGKALAMITMNDGTEFTFTVLVKDNVTEARTVAVVKPASAEQGSVTLAVDDVTDAAGKLSVTTTNDVTITAVPSQAYDFVKWTKGGEDFSTQNPYIYTEKPSIELTPVFAQNKWAGVTENKSEYGTVQSYSQYASTISFTPNAEEAVEIYQTSTCPENLYNVVPTMVSAAKGSAFTLNWTGKGLNYTRLSAYIDLNGDGDFGDEGEFAGTIGELSQQNASLNNSSMQFVLPYDATVGLTHVRLRFDGAWETGNMTSAGGREPYATTTRMVYDVKLNITEYSTAPTTTITAVSEDAAKGSVRITGGQIDNQNPAIVNEGKEVTLDAIPADGYKFQQWVDEFDRVVSTDAHCVFRPAGSCTYRAEFVGSDDDFFYKGEGKVYTFAVRDVSVYQSLRKTGTWKITMDIQSDGSAFNEYGSVAIASGANPLNDYTFQLYMTKNGTVKLFGTDTGISASQDFTAEISYDGTKIYGHFIGKDTNGNDKETGANNSWYFSRTPEQIGDITDLSCALPEGVNIKSLTITANYDDAGWATPPSSLDIGDPYVTGNGQVVKMHAKDYITNIDSEGHTKYNYVPQGKAWQMIMDVTHKDGQEDSYNQWGSCILASEADPINTYYWNNFQVYEHSATHKSPGTLNFKSNKGDGNDHIIAQGHNMLTSDGYEDYRVIVRYDGNQTYLIRTIILDADGNPTGQVFNNVWIAARVQHDIDVMSCALPEGTNLMSLAISIAEESNLLEDVDYAIQNITNKDYLTNGELSHSEMAGDAAHYQIKWTRRSDLTYTDTDGGLHHSFYIKVLVGDSWQWLKLDQSNYTTVVDEEQATAFIYSDNSKMVQPIENRDQPGVAWAINADDKWFWDFFANFYVEVAGNNAGGLTYTKGGAKQTATNGQYLELPAGVNVNQLANSSQLGYMAAISKADIRLKVQYTPLENTFYNIAAKTPDAQPVLYYWYKNQQTLVTYSTTNSKSGKRTEWGETGDCSKFSITKVTEIPIKLSLVGSAYYGSVCCPNAITLPEGVTAYSLKGITQEGNYLLTPIEGEILPAGTPALLVSEEEMQSDPSGNWSISITGPSVINDNLFAGAFENTDNPGAGNNASSPIYVLGNKTGVGFYRYVGSYIPAFKAYYESPASVASDKFLFTFDNDDLTSVSTVVTGAPAMPVIIYDLMGNKVTQMEKNKIYIINGKPIKNI